MALLFRTLLILVVGSASDLFAQETPAALLAGWVKEGKAVGFGDLRYDNRDRGHSPLPLAQYPGLVSLEKTPEEAQQTGPPQQIFPRPVVGNCSMAADAHQGGSIGRRIVSVPQGHQLLQAQYLNNQVYVYPEHRDHDPGVNRTPGYGDLFPANSPCLVVTQGSSFSDRAVVSAFLRTMASFSPEMYGFLRSQQMLAPTVQAIFRQHYRPGAALGAEGYFQGASHPLAFEPKGVDELAMMKTAQAMTKETIPAVALLEVTGEDYALAGRDFFEAKGVTEKLSDSPSCVARVYRTRAPFRKMKVSARRSAHPGSTRLQYRWELLRGDPQQVKIDTAADGGSAEITIAYHPRTPISKGGPIQSNRVDIGVFASHDGKTWSAPAMICSMTLANEDRIYGVDGKLKEIFYGAGSMDPGFPSTLPLKYVPFLEHFGRDVNPVLSARLRSAVSADEAKALAALHRSLITDYQTVVGKRAVLDAEAKEWIARRQASGKGLKEALTEEQKKVATEKHQALVAESQVAEAERKKRFAATEAIVDQMKPGLTRPLAGGKESAEKVVERALKSLVDDPMLYFTHAAAIDQLAAKPPVRNQLKARLQELLQLGVLDRVPGGTYRVRSQNGRLAANDFHHLQRLNLEILGRVLFPEFLSYPNQANYVDPNLSSRKVWRDVFSYDASGKMTGWRRLGGGKASDFNARGELLTPSAATGDLVPRRVEYRRTEKGELQMVP